MNSRTAKLAIAILVILAIVITVSCSWGGDRDGGGEFITEPAIVQPLVQEALANGVLEPVELVSVGARASGQVMRLHVKLGESVKAGQLIAEIDARPQRNAVRNAEGALESVKAERLAREAELAQSKRLLTRRRGLLQADAGSREDYEAALAQHDVLVAQIASLRGQIKQADATLETARTDLDYTRIMAPINGVVVAVVTEAGRTVNAFQEAPTIVVLANLDRMKVRAEISEADITRVRVGQKVYFTVLGEPDKRHYATLQSVEPAPASIVAKAQEGSGEQPAADVTAKKAVYYFGSFELPNPGHLLRPMMTAQVRIILNEIRNALTIPVAAVLSRDRDGADAGGTRSGDRADAAAGGSRSGDGDARPESTGTRAGNAMVRVLDADGQAVQRRVRLGASNGVRVQVLDGLKAGERVVIGDAANATPGGQNWD